MRNILWKNPLGVKPCKHSGEIGQSAWIQLHLRKEQTKCCHFLKIQKIIRPNLILLRSTFRVCVCVQIVPRELVHCSAAVLAISQTGARKQI